MILKKTSTIYYLIISLALLTASESQAQLSVNGGMTPTQLVQNVLVGTGVTVTNITYTGDVSARGSFNGTASNVGFASGILLATGDLNNAVGPNDNSGLSTYFGTSSSDPDLTIIASGGLNDAAILEFDFIPVSDTLKFRYVFASEEYPEWVCSDFNDVFGFFISGPKPAGGTYTNQNIAVIPSSNPPLAVAINTVNPGVIGLNGNAGSCISLAYSSHYFDNGNGIGSGSAPDGATVQYDGFTHPLTAKAAVICGQTYHIKIAIADVIDDAIDSGVFLEAGSFTSQGVTINPQNSYSSANDSTLYEGCGETCIYFVRTTNLSIADTVNLAIEGSAINGADYNTGMPGVPLPSQLIFQAGQDSVSYCINAVSDGITEGQDTIGLSIIQTGICGQFTSSAKIYINDYSPLMLNTMSDTTFCNYGMGGTVTLNANVSGGVEPYTYLWTNGASAIANPTVTVNNTTTFKVTVNDVCGTVSDSIKVSVLNFPAVTVGIFPTPSYGGPNDSVLYEDCGQVCINFVRTSSLSVADTLLLIAGGQAQNGIDYYDNLGSPLPNQLIFPLGQDTITYCINALPDASTEGLESINLSIFQSNPCVQSSISTNIYLNEYQPLTLTTSGDSIFCNFGMGGSVTLNAIVSGGIEPYSYSWSNGAGSGANPTVTANTTTTYSVTVNDACLGTPDPTPPITDSVNIFVLNFPAIDVDIYTGISYGGVNDSILYEGCGQACIIFVRTSSLAVADVLTLTIAGSAQNGIDYYYGTPGISLPNQLVFPVGQDTIIWCINASPDANNTEGPEDINLSVFQSNPCIQSTASATIPISEHPPLSVSTSGDTLLCNQGGTVTLHANLSGGLEPYSYLWTNGAASVANPIVTVNTSTTFVLTANDACSGSPDPTPAVIDSIVVSVKIFAPLTIHAGNDVDVCPGEVVNLSASANGGGAPYIYNWSNYSAIDSLTSYNTASTTLTANTSGIYQISVLDICQNVQYDQVNIMVDLSCELTVPNVITPDGQGSSENESFYIHNLDNFSGSTLVLYDRWGKKIYSSSNYLNDWNGDGHGDGTYYYVLTVSDGRTLKGFFLISRLN